MGGIIDRIGTKKGYTISIALWSFFGMLHAAIRPAFSLIGFMAARFGLGLGESGNFPSAIKTVAEWFPKKDRAFATGIFDSSTSIGGNSGSCSSRAYCRKKWRQLASPFPDHRFIKFTLGIVMVEDLPQTRGAS